MTDSVVIGHSTKTIPLLGVGERWLTSDFRLVDEFGWLAVSDRVCRQDLEDVVGARLQVVNKQLISCNENGRTSAGTFPQSTLPLEGTVTRYPTRGQTCPQSLPCQRGQ